MYDCSDSDRKVSATKKIHSRSTKKRVVYFAKSDSELESNEDGGSLVGFQNNGLDHGGLAMVVNDNCEFIFEG